MWFKICGRSRSDLKMSNNKHLLLQWPFIININYHKIPLRIFLGDIRILPMAQALAPLNPRPHPTPLPLHPCPIFLPKPLPHPLSLGHLVTLGPPTPPNLNISTIRVGDPWVSIQIKFWASLLSTKEVPHTCKIVIFNRQFSLGHFVTLAPLTFLNLNIAAIWVTDPWVSI